MKYYLIAGEASGDLHASQPVAHYRDTAFMGFAEVILNIRSIKKFIDLCKKDLLDYLPDVLILVDYPGFNLRIAEFAHQHKLPTHYYISPKVWAWKKNRAFKIKEFIEKLYVIFPFEIDFYKNYDYQVSYVGNPVVDAVDEALAQLPSIEQFKTTHNLGNKEIIALLPGSRKQEIKYNLPLMLKLIPKFPDYQFVIALSRSLERTFVENYTRNADVKFVHDQTYALLKCAKAAVVTSGTATLETALIGTPQLVCYKGEHLSYQVAKRIVDVKYISLVNLVADKEIIKEYIQYDMTEKKLTKELTKLLINCDYILEMKAGYQSVRLALGESGASARTAKLIYKSLNFDSNAV